MRNKVLGASSSLYISDCLGYSYNTGFLCLLLLLTHPGVYMLCWLFCFVDSAGKSSSALGNFILPHSHGAYSSCRTPQQLFLCTIIFI